MPGFQNDPRRSASQGLRRDIALLEALVSADAQAGGGLGVNEIARAVDRDKSQVSRALKSLAEVGVVERDPGSRRYRLGLRLFSLLARAAEARLLHLAPTYMSELVESLEETVHLCVLQGASVLTVLSESPRQGFRASGWAGRTVPAYCTSAGRVLLMDKSEGEIEDLFRGAEFEQRGPRLRVRDVEALKVEVAGLRASGFALVDEEFEGDLVGVSAPVRNANGKVIAALNVSARKGRLGDRLESAGKETLAVSEELSEVLGWRARTLSLDVPS